MKVFISWSGDLSHSVAVELREWLPSVIQAVEPYVSSEDIDKGVRWSTDIAKELEQSSFGILCVTLENLEAPWLNFEAGALSKSIDKSRVCPFLFGLKRSDISTGPILQFQSTEFEHDDVAKLLHSINNVSEPRCIDEARLNSIFDVWWPKLEKQLKNLSGQANGKEANHDKSKTKRKERTERAILEELLDLARNQQKAINDPGRQIPAAYIDHLIRRIASPAIHPEVYIELRDGLQKLREICANCSKENIDITISSINDIVLKLERPFRYLCNRLEHRDFVTRSDLFRFRDFEQKP